MPRDSLSFLYGQVVPQCRHDIDKHFDGYYTLQYMNGGAVELGIDDRLQRLEGRWFWSCWPGPRIRFHVARGFSSWSHRYIAFRGEIAKRWERDGLFPIQPQSAPKGLDYAARFDELLALAQRGDAWGARRCLNAMEAILLELAEARDQHVPATPWVDGIVRTLHDSVSHQAPDYERMAGESGMSITTFRRRFRQALGISPHEYLLRCRVNAARQMLASTSLPIKEIAQRLGYSDVYFFTRQFSRVAGVSPARYRRSCAG